MHEEGKKNIIAGLIEEYDIKTANYIQEALKDLLGDTIQKMLEAELNEHLGYESYERSDNPDYRNSTKPKRLTYIILGVNADGYKEILSIIVGENESAKYLLSVLNSLKIAVYRIF